MDAPHSTGKRKDRDGGGDDLQAWLASVPLREVAPKKQDLFQLEHNMSVGTALSEFAKRKILSAPLVIAPTLDDALDAGDTPPPDTPTLLGWVDTRDILEAFTRFLDDTLAEDGRVLPTRMLELMTLLEKVGPSFASLPLVRVRGGGDRELVYQASADATSLLDALDVLRFLTAHKERLGALASKTLAEAGLLTGKPPVATVDPHTPTLLALKSMLAAGVSGAAVVVTGGGTAIANLSVSDIRAVQPHHLGVLSLPVAEFLSLLHGTSYAGYSVGGADAAREGGPSAAHPFFASHRGAGRAAAGPSSPTAAAGPDAVPGEDDDGGGGGDVRLVTVAPDATVYDAMATMVRLRIHRLYVASDAGAPKPTAVVTPTDIMRLICGVY